MDRVRTPSPRAPGRSVDTGMVDASPGAETVGSAPARIRCRAVLLDAGGVIVLPHGGLVSAALARVGIACQAGSVARAHYRAVREIDRTGEGHRAGYVPEFCKALGIPNARREEAVLALSRLADRTRSGEILWSEAVPNARRTIDALIRRGISVLVVTNSDGHAAENLRDAEICQTTSGPGAVVRDVIDSGLIGSAKPDPVLFGIALQRAGIGPRAAVHVGDMVSTDVVGARAAGIVPIHVDPYRRCRAPDHRHVRTLSGIWRHVVPASEPMPPVP